MQPVRFGVKQSTLQGDHFARVVSAEAGLGFPLEDAANKMAVIDPLHRSGEGGGWDEVRG